MTHPVASCVACGREYETFGGNESSYCQPCAVPICRGPWLTDDGRPFHVPIGGYYAPAH